MANTKQRRIDPTTLHGDDMILWFDDLGTGNEQYRFLSNFYRGEPITIPGVYVQGEVAYDENGIAKSFRRYETEDERNETLVEFPTGEHAFAALKVNHRAQPLWFHSIVNAPDPNTAKALGRSCPLRDEWEVVKLDVMAAVTRAKYTLDREEGALLINTDDRLLVEGTFWHDRVWGVDLNNDLLPGRNWLGTLLMARRAELQLLDRMGKHHASVRALNYVENVQNYNALFGVA